MSSQTMADETKLTIVEHLEELRDRLIVVAIALVVSTVFSFVFTDWLLKVLVHIAPPDLQIIALHPTENFVVYMKVALTAGVALAMPVILYEIVRFLLPGLTPQEKRYVLFLVPGGTLSFVAGLAFAVALVLPAAIGFLMRFEGDLIKSQWSIENYINFVTMIMFWMGIIFELPLVMFFLAKLGIINPQMLGQFRRFWIVLAAVIAAAVTPTPDPVNMMIVMVPLLLLYEVGVILTRIAVGRGGSAKPARAV